MPEPLSICIPAYNEATTIAQTLDSVMAQEYPGELEVRVCANGCNDATAEIVRDYGRGVELIETAERGKPNAWNLLRAAARHNYIVFMDGDVIVEPTAFQALTEGLDEGYSAVTGVDHKHYSLGTLHMWLFQHPSALPGNLCGALYAINNERVTRALEQFGFKMMPPNLIVEDLWLTNVVGRNHWSRALDAVVHTQMPDLRDFLAYARRCVEGVRQLEAEYATLPDARRDFWEEDAVAGESAFQRWSRRLSAQESVPDIFRLFLGFPFRKVLERKCQHIVDEAVYDPRRTLWTPLSSTKKTGAAGTPVQQQAL